MLDIFSKWTTKYKRLGVIIVGSLVFVIFSGLIWCLYDYLSQEQQLVKFNKTDLIADNIEQGITPEIIEKEASERMNRALRDRRTATTKDLMEFFNHRPWIGTLSTADKNGRPDSAYFGSPQMIDEKTIIMGFRYSRTLSNLKENPFGVFLVIKPHETKFIEWRGVRIYVKMVQCETSGSKLDTVRAFITKLAGPSASKLLQYVVTFEIYDIRPLADYGQGWRKSI